MVPQEVKDARPELVAIWKIGQCLWNRHYASGLGTRRDAGGGGAEDAAGRELPAWALAKAAPGGRVVALHVTADAADGLLETVGAAPNSLASVLGAYDGFCNLKQGEEIMAAVMDLDATARRHRPNLPLGTTT